MPVTRPEDMAQSFAEAFNSGNVDAVLALYESNAVLVAPPGQLTRSAPSDDPAAVENQKSEGAQVFMIAMADRWR